MSRLLLLLAFLSWLSIGNGESVSAAQRLQWDVVKNLWPIPTDYQYGTKEMTIDDSFSIHLALPAKSEDSNFDILNHALIRFSDQMLLIDKVTIFESRTMESIETLKCIQAGNCGWYADLNGQNLKSLHIAVKSEGDTLSVDTDESYSLYVLENGAIDITSETIYGVLRALQTLKQLINRTGNRLSIQSIPWEINDEPRFPWRGISLDTSRSFFPIADLERTLDAMEYVKLNVLHLHLTDSQSFPVEIKSFPDLTQGYSEEMVYSHRDILNLVQYAKDRGIRIVPEFDTPGHAATWQGKTKKYENITACVNFQPWKDYCVQPPCGQLDPSVDYTYDVLKGVIGEISTLFNDDYYHSGSDEPNQECWKTSKHVKNWIAERGMSAEDPEAFIKLEKTFNDKRRAMIKSHQKKEVAWDDILDKSPPASTTIQIWHTESSYLEKAFSGGHSIILSPYSSYYLDCGTGNYVTHNSSWCKPYKTWWDIYRFELVKDTFSKKQTKQILGGEVAIWSEAIDSINLDQKLWPRAAALAERLWSEKPKSFDGNTQAFALKRILLLRERMLTLLNIKGSSIQPLWCLQDTIGYCVNDHME